MKEKIKRLGPFIKRLGPFWDDILFLAGGVCFTTAGGLFAGAAFALAVAGAWMTILAILVARGKGAGGSVAETGDPS